MGVTVSAHCDSRSAVSCSDGLGHSLAGVTSGFAPLVSGLSAVSSTSSPSQGAPLACGGAHCECTQVEEYIGKPIFAETISTQEQECQLGDHVKPHAITALRSDDTGHSLSYDFWNAAMLSQKQEGDDRCACPSPALEENISSPHADVGASVVNHVVANEVGITLPMTPVALEAVPMRRREGTALKNIQNTMQAHTPRREPASVDAVDSVMDHITNNFADIQDAIGFGADKSFVPLVVVRGEDGDAKCSWDRRKHGAPKQGPCSSQRGKHSRRACSTSFKPIRPRIFTIILDRSSGEDRLGIDVSQQDRQTLLILEVKAGLVADWNASHPQMDVNSGDRIIKVNSVQDRSDLMLKECETLGVLEITIRRARVLYHCAEPAAKFFSERTPCTPRPEESQRKSNDDIVDKTSICATATATAWGEAEFRTEEAPKEAGEYFRSDSSLWTMLKDDDVVLLRGSWLAELARCRGVLPRRQDLPRTATLAPEAVFKPIARGNGNANVHQPQLQRQVDIVVVSHCWLTPEHPDPKGDQLQLLGSFVDKYLQSEKHDLGIFLDWCSLPQAPRTSAEQLAFNRSREEISVWYAHQHTWKWMLTKLPTAYKDAYISFEDRGWTSFESVLGQMVSHSGTVLDLGKFDPAHCKDWRSLTCSCTVAVRPPPMSPEEFARLLEAKSFSHSCDRRFLVAKYKETFEDIFASAERLDFSFHDWGDEQVRLLAKALPHFSCLKCLYLNWNHIGDAGVEEIAAQLPRCASLLELSLAGNPISSACGRRLREIWRSVGKTERQKLILW